MHRIFTTVGIIGAMLFCSFASLLVAAGQAGGKTLFNRLGGKKAITRVVDDFVARCAADARISSYFAKTAGDPKRLKEFKQKLADQICEASSGPCRYTGKDMKTAHAGMGITGDAFNSLVEDLTESMVKLNVGPAEMGELLNVLAPMKGDVVEKK